MFEEYGADMLSRSASSRIIVRFLGARRLSAIISLFILNGFGDPGRTRTPNILIRSRYTVSLFNPQVHPKQ